MIVTNGSTLWKSNVASSGKSEGSDGKVTKMGDFPAMELMTKGYTDTPWKPKKWNPTKRDLEDDAMIPLYNLQKHGIIRFKYRIPITNGC